MDNQKEGCQKQLGSFSQEDGGRKLAFREGSYGRVPALSEYKTRVVKANLSSLCPESVMFEYSEETEAEKCTQCILFVSGAIYFSCHHVNLGSWFSVWGVCMQRCMCSVCIACLYIISCVSSATEELSGEKEGFAFCGKGGAQSMGEQEASTKSCG